MPGLRPAWRVVHTGLRPAAQNIALNRCLLDGHQAGDTPDTLRFLQFEPSALIGYHQSVEQEIQLEYCREQGIQVQRRLTGGGAIYFDPAHLGWELYLPRDRFKTPDMQKIARRICEAAADALQRLGIDARYRPRNDIEVEGRKISGTGGVFAEDSFLYQGTLLLDLDVERMLSVLRVPMLKLSDKAIQSIRERMVSVREVLGFVPSTQAIQEAMTQAFAEHFDVQFQPAPGLNAAEEARYRQVLPEIDCDTWVQGVLRERSAAPLLEGMYRCAGGLIRAAVAVDRERELVKQACFTGDFFVYPPRSILDLEAFLKDTPLRDLRERVYLFFKQHVVQMYMLTAEDFCAALEQALAATSDSASAGAAHET